MAGFLFSNNTVKMNTKIKKYVDADDIPSMFMDFVKDSGLHLALDGMYNPALSTVETSIQNWVDTGESPLVEHRKVTNLYWELKGSHEHYEFTKCDLDLIGKFIDGETFWHLENWWDSFEQVREVYEFLQENLRQQHIRNKPKSVKEEARIKANKAISNKSLRKKVFSRDNFQCNHCESTINLSVDHIHPVAKGGGNELSNLQTLCRSCNSKKGDR